MSRRTSRIVGGGAVVVATASSMLLSGAGVEKLLDWTLAIVSPEARPWIYYGAACLVIGAGLARVVAAFRRFAAEVRQDLAALKLDLRRMRRRVRKIGGRTEKTELVVNALQISVGQITEALFGMGHWAALSLKQARVPAAIDQQNAAVETSATKPTAGG